MEAGLLGVVPVAAPDPHPERTASQRPAAKTDRIVAISHLLPFANQETKKGDVDKAKESAPKQAGGRGWGNRQRQRDWNPGGAAGLPSAAEIKID